MPKIAIISDTHNHLDKLNLPDVDLLIHAGDWTTNRTLEEILKFNYDCGQIKHKFKYGILAIAGNHETLFDLDYQIAKLLCTNFTYIQDQLFEFRNIRIYGSPWQPTFGIGWAFNLNRGKSIKRVWDQIKPCDILVTHGPPYGILDTGYGGLHGGCKDLLKAVKRIKPLLHIFGHFHSGYGVKLASPTTFINASICNSKYKPINKPFVIEIDEKTKEVTICN